MRKTLVLLMILLVSFPIITPVCAIRHNYVYDWDDMITDDQESVINDFCSKVDENTTAEIVVITLKDGEGRTEEQARIFYFNDFELDGVKGIGKEGKDNGVLLIVCLKDNFWGIEVGYGLEGDLTDSEAGRIGRDILVENLKDYKDFDALLKTVKAIAKEIGYDKTETTNQNTNENQLDELAELNGFFAILMLMVIIVLFVSMLSVFSSSGGRSSGYSSYGGGSGGGGAGGGGAGGGGSGGGGAGGGIRIIPIMEQPLKDLRLRITMISPFILKLFCPSCLQDMICISNSRPRTETRDINENRIGDYIHYDKIKTHYIYANCLTCHSHIVKKTELSRESDRRYNPRSTYKSSSSYRSSSFRSSSFRGGSFGGGRSGGGGSGGRIR